MIEEIPKHRRRREKHPPKKSKHKHIYDVHVLFVRHTNHHWFREYHFSGNLCSICGKVGDTNLFELDENSRMMSGEEIVEKYKDLPMVEYSWEQKFYKLP